MNRHIEECEFQLIFCNNNESCGLIMRCKMEAHLTQSCIYRMEKCVLKCGVRLPLIEMDRHVVKDCSKALIKCKNGCTESIERGHMSHHI